jgi:hypothetical protein
MTVQDSVVDTASKHKLALVYNAQGQTLGLPATMYIKGGCHGPEQMRLGGHGYMGEIGFYNDLAHQLPLEVPASYSAANDAEYGQPIVLLENLTVPDLLFGDATRPVTVQTVAATLEGPADLHAFCRQPQDVHRLGTWRSVIAHTIELLLASNSWGPRLARPLESSVPTHLRDPQVVLAALKAKWKAELIWPFCLIHADAHLGNMYLLANGSRRFLICALSVKDRRHIERDLIVHYLACLKAKGVGPPLFDAAWLSYRQQQAMRGFIWAAAPHPETTIVHANTKRFCPAAQDLATLNRSGSREQEYGPTIQQRIRGLPQRGARLSGEQLASGWR